MQQAKFVDVLVFLVVMLMLCVTEEEVQELVCAGLEQLQIQHFVVVYVQKAAKVEQHGVRQVRQIFVAL
jgi:hypothetical protein|tara:strand:- start:494 stop:700 length:207 start_codon:yes stop_codon:yes gene_type:complete